MEIHWVGSSSEPIKRSRLFGEFVHANFVYIRRREGDTCRFQVCQLVSQTGR